MAKAVLTCGVCLFALLVYARHGGTLRWTELSSKRGDIAAPGPSVQQTGTIVADFDGNGVADFMITARKTAPSVLWYRRSKSGWDRYVVDDSLLAIEAGCTAADVDRDGDLDVLCGGDYSSNEVWWWENPSPAFDAQKPWMRRTIKNTGKGQHHDLITGDFDGDGQAELVFWNQGARRLYMAKFPADPRNAGTWTFSEVFTSDTMAEGLAAADIDGDGLVDIIGGGRWFKRNPDGSFTANIIDAEQPFTRAAAGVFRRGGTPQVLFVPGDRVGRLKLYERREGAWVATDLLGFDVIHGHSLQVADIDHDGNPDIFCAEMGKWTEKAERPDNPNPRMWIFLGDGKGAFRKVEYRAGVGNHEDKIADLNGDGKLDILIKPYNWDAPRVDVWLQK